MSLLDNYYRLEYLFDVLKFIKVGCEECRRMHIQAANPALLFLNPALIIRLEPIYLVKSVVDLRSMCMYDTMRARRINNLILKGCR